MTTENETGPGTAESSERRQAERQLIKELVGRAQAEGLQLTGDGGLLQQSTTAGVLTRR